MDCLIVTGLSGAGKSLAVRALEDIGFYCVDNLPPVLIAQFVRLSRPQEVERRLAIVCDVRGGEDFGHLFQALETLRLEGVNYKILFLEARVDVLERRFKETRRRHPLSIKDNLSTEDALLREQQILAPVYSSADYVIDTTLLSTAQLRQSIVGLFATEEKQAMQLNFISFGFKFGLPKNADLVFDVRCLPNPFYVAALKHKTGLEEEVEAYVLGNDTAVGLLDRLSSLLYYSVPLYKSEGKSELTIAVGCTGGKHRSVVFCERLAALFKEDEPFILHRDIGR